MVARSQARVPEVLKTEDSIGRKRATRNSRKSSRFPESITSERRSLYLNFVERRARGGGSARVGLNTIFFGNLLARPLTQILRGIFDPNPFEHQEPPS